MTILKIFETLYLTTNIILIIALILYLILILFNNKGKLIFKIILLKSFKYLIITEIILLIFKIPEDPYIICFELPITTFICFICFLLKTDIKKEKELKEND